MSDFTFKGGEDMVLRLPPNDFVLVAVDGEDVWRGTFKAYGELLSLLEDSAPLYRCVGPADTPIGCLDFVQVYPKPKEDDE